MKTQINDLINGSQRIAGTNHSIRDARGEQVLKENGDTLTLHFTTERGSADIRFKRELSITGKSWYYVSEPIAAADAAIIGYDMSVYKHLYIANIILYSDMRCEIHISTRETENHKWKFRRRDLIDNSIITIL